MKKHKHPTKASSSLLSPKGQWLLQRRFQHLFVLKKVHVAMTWMYNGSNAVTPNEMQH